MRRIKVKLQHGGLCPVPAVRSGSAHRRIVHLYYISVRPQFDQNNLDILHRASGGRYHEPQYWPIDRVPVRRPRCILDGIRHAHRACTCATAGLRGRAGPYGLRRLGTVLVAAELLWLLEAAAILLRPAVLWASLLRSALLWPLRLSPLVTFEGALGPRRFSEIMSCAVIMCPKLLISDPDQR